MNEPQPEPQPGPTVLTPSESDPVLELLVQWEERRAAGDSVSAEQLCPHDLRLQQELRDRIARRERMLAALEISPDVPAGFAAGRSPGALPELPGYEILEVVGQGGMGVVYKARQLGLNRVVAIKMILSGVNASPQELARFRSEAEAVARLAHPNIVQIYEIGEQNNCPYLTLEFVSGGSLSQQIEGNPLPPRRAADLVLALAKGMQHAHDRGIVHRDLKPGNVLIAADGTPKIADFGLAKRAEGNLAHTMTGAIIGSPTYMAPEQASGSGEISPATDVYALGVILYEMLTGRPPFKADSVIETIQQVREQDPLPPRIVQPKIPRDLEIICLKCLEKKPQNRYPNAAALAMDLQAYLHDEPIRAQSLTLLDQVARTLSHHGFDDRVRGIGNWMLWFSPIPLTLHIAAYALLAGKPYYATGMIITTCGMFFLFVPALIWLGMPSLRSLPTWQRRHFVTTWIGHTVAIGLMLAVVVLAIPADQPNLRLLIYGIWACAAAMSFLSHAVEAGMYYIVAAAMFCMALLLAVTPYWAPLEVAFFMTVNLIIQGVYLRKRTTEPEYFPGNSQIAAATTQVPPASKGAPRK